MAINGKIYSGNIEVAIVKENEVKVIDKRAPLYFKENHFIDEWLEKRAVDSHRINSRLLKKVLRLENKDDISTVLSVNAVTITDDYWFKPETEENLTWENVQFNRNEFSSLALNGDPNDFSKNPSRTPELTNIGSFEKCWKLENDKWFLYKTGKKNEFFSEIFISKLGKKLDFNMADYEYDGEHIKTADFTNSNEVNYEAMYSLVKDNDDYNLSFNTLFKINENLAKDYLKMIYLDTVCYNMDRHTFNYGVLRNKETGDIICLAPNFDLNIALVSRELPKDINRENDGLIKFFFEFLAENKQAFNMFKELNIPNITADLINDTLKEVPDELKENLNLNDIKEFILNGNDKINNFNYSELND